MTDTLKPPPRDIEKPSEQPVQQQRNKQWFNDVYQEINTLAAPVSQTVTSAGAIDLESEYVDISTTGSAYAITLAAPTTAGITKTIEMTADSGHNITMSLTNCVNGSASTTCTWNDVNDALVLISGSTKWQIVAENGVSLT